jgi:Electron transfer DM13
LDVIWIRSGKIVLIIIRDSYPMKKSIIAAIVAAAIAVPAGAYAASPLFINTMVNEPVPVADEKITKGTPAEDTAMADKNDNAMMNKALTGLFAGAGDGIHNAEGVAKVIYLDAKSGVLRLEDLKVTNGPDLYIYLATDKQASDFVDLGKLKANNGNQNYDIPEGTDLSKYNTVLVWCKQFSVLFGSAELTAGMSA